MSREGILGRVREALSRPSDPDVRALAGDGNRDPRAARVFMPAGGQDFEERWDIFCRLSEKLKVEVLRVPDEASAKQTLTDLANVCEWKRIASHHSPLTDALVPGLSDDTVWTDDRPDTEALESSDVGITVCEALISQTGSVLVTSKGCGGRALSVLPPHHVVLATTDQLLPDLLAGYDILRERYREKLPSFISFITGASRTGDIERILVLGAHGPKRLTVIVVG